MSVVKTRPANQADDIGYVKRAPVTHLFDASGNGFLNSGNTPEKREHRRIVTEHFLSAEATPRCLSLPGEGWDVEKALLEHYQQAIFVGCERDISTYHLSQRYMPEADVKWSTKLKYSWTLKNGLTYDAVGTSPMRSALLHMNILDALQIYNKSYSRTSCHRLVNLFKDGFNTYWLDSFGPLGSHENLAIARAMFGRATANPTEWSTFAFTFMLGRDLPETARVFNTCPGEDGVERRANFLQLLGQQRGNDVVITGCHRHPSWNKDGNVHMGTVMGRFLRRRDDVYSADAAATAIVESIVTDLKDRGGLGSEWGGLAADTRHEIEEEWRGLIAPIVTAAVQAGLQPVKAAVAAVDKLVAPLPPENTADTQLFAKLCNANAKEKELRRIFPALKATLTRMMNTGTNQQIIETVDRAEKKIEEIGCPFPDDWGRWQNAKEDAERQLKAGKN